MQKLGTPSPQPLLAQRVPSRPRPVGAFLLVVAGEPDQPVDDECPAPVIEQANSRPDLFSLGGSGFPDTHPGTIRYARIAAAAVFWPIAPSILPV